MKLLFALLWTLPGSVQAQAANPLGRGINLGNALEAPHEGDRGLRIEAGYFKLIAEAGFDTVRLPIKWSAHASQKAPYTVSRAFLARVDEILAQALAQDLNVILDFHHYDQMATAPEAHAARWVGIWRQLAEHYREAPKEVYFDLLNEPNSTLTDALWNAYLARAVTFVRTSNPTRKLIIGPTG